MPKTFRKILFALVALAALTIFTFIIFLSLSRPQFPPLPNPNGYDDFLQASKAIKGDLSKASTLDHDALKQLLAANAEPSRQLHLGLTRDCSIPTEAALKDGVNMNELADLKNLVRLLVAEGQLAEKENRPADAIQSYTDAIRYGDEISRGGFLINRFVGIACESIGLAELVRLAPTMSCVQNRPLIAGLEKIDATGITWDEVMRNEKMYMRHQLRRSLNPIMWASALWLSRPAKQKAELKQEMIVARLRLFATELALRCYQSDEGHPPDKIEQLVPKYLQRVPADPFNGQTLVYRPQGTNWLLYSVGTNGVNATGIGKSGGIFYDSGK